MHGGQVIAAARDPESKSMHGAPIAGRDRTGWVTPDFLPVGANRTNKGES